LDAWETRNLTVISKNMAKKNSKKYNYSALIAKHFGFDVQSSFSVNNESIKLGKTAKKEPKYFDNHMPPIEELIQMISNYKEFEKEHGPVPQMLYFDSPATGSHTKHRKRPGEELVTLHIMGVENSIAEAIMIKTISVILSECGQKKHMLHLNNVGGKESRTQFNREATAFFRKHISMLNANCRQFLKDGVHTLITEGGDQCRILKEHAPESMDFLNEDTRKEFSALIERIETFEMPYEINADVLGDLNYSNHTTFHFVEEKTGKVIAAGSRYNLLCKKMGLRKEIPAISANVWIKSPKTVAESAFEKIDNSKNFILQLGDQAKTFTLQVLTELWHGKVHAKHNLIKDRLSPQIQESKKEKAENIIIVGHKEAMDMNVMIRDAEGKSQKIMTTQELVRMLKKK
jgi:histidyl-tRNA synthetase